MPLKSGRPERTVPRTLHGISGCVGVKTIGESGDRVDEERRCTPG